MKRDNANGQNMELREILHEALINLSHQERVSLPQTLDLKEFEKNCPIDLQLYTCINSQNGNSKQI